MERKKTLTVMLSNNTAEALYHAMVICLSALEIGWKVNLFVTSNAIPLFTKKAKKPRFGMNFLVNLYLRFQFRKLKISDVDKLIKTAITLGMKVYVDEIGLKISGLNKWDLIENAEIGGGILFLKVASESDLVLSF